jgi:hypothetical protein
VEEHGRERKEETRGSVLHGNLRTRGMEGTDGTERADVMEIYIEKSPSGAQTSVPSVPFVPFRRPDQYCILLL